MTDSDFTLSRRKFLDRIAMASAGAAMAAAAPWAAIAQTPVATGNRVRLGVIGTGDRGRALIQNIAKTRNCTVAAICDNYAPNMDRARKLVPADTPGFSDHDAARPSRIAYVRCPRRRAARLVREGDGA